MGLVFLRAFAKTALAVRRRSHYLVGRIAIRNRAVFGRLRLSPRNFVSWGPRRLLSQKISPLYPPSGRVCMALYAPPPVGREQGEIVFLLRKKERGFSIL